MTTLSVVANETHEQAVADFKVSEKYAYGFIMKVKRIREERLYKELGFSSFDEYCEEAWKTKRDFMDQRIQIADSLGESYFADTYRQLGHSKSLMLARMEPEVRKQIEASTDVSEATVKELKNLEKKLKEKEELLESTKSSAEHWQKVAKSAQNIPPRIETRTVEVTPPDYADLQKQAAVAQQLNSENVQLKRASESMRQNYEDKLSEQKKQDSVKKDLQKYLSEQLRAITMNHDSAIFNFTEVQGDREAYDIVMRYLNQYESIIKQQFSEWEQLTSIRAVK